MSEYDDEHLQVLFCACQRNPTVLQPDGSKDWQVICRHCGRRGPTAGTRWFAVKLWNNDRRGVTSATNPTTRGGEG